MMIVNEMEETWQAYVDAKEASIDALSAVRRIQAGGDEYNAAYETYCAAHRACEVARAVYYAAVDRRPA